MKNVAMRGKKLAAVLLAGEAGDEVVDAFDDRFEEVVEAAGDHGDLAGREEADDQQQGNDDPGGEQRVEDVERAPTVARVSP